MDVDDKKALIGLGFLVFGLGIWLGRITAETDLMLQIEDFQANGGQIIPPKSKGIEIKAVSIESI